MKAIVYYNLSVLFKSNKFVLPLLIYICYLPFSYTILPVEPLGGYTLSACMVYFVMVWMGTSIYQAEAPVLEQIAL